MKSVSSRFNLTQNLLEIDFIPGLGRAAGEGRLPTPVFLGSPGVSDGKESAYSPWGRKELDTAEQVSLFFTELPWYQSQFFPAILFLLYLPSLLRYRSKGKRDQQDLW